MRTFATNRTISTDVMASVAVRASQTACSCARAGKASAVVVGGVVEVAVLVVLRTGMVAVVSTVAEVTKTTSCATSDVLGHTLELVITLFAAAKDTSL
jgi:hypothetical protein